MAKLGTWHFWNNRALLEPLLGPLSNGSATG